MIGDNLHIVVCVKQTVSATSGGSPWAPGQPMAMNPFDEYALEEGVRLKERAGGKGVVTVVTLGAPGAAESIRDAVARGADGGILLSDAAFAGSDTLGTARALAAAVQKLSKDKGPVDVVLFGKQTNDSDTGSVGPQVAAVLDAPNVVFVRKLEVAGGKATAERMVEEGADVIELDLPAVISVVKEINEPRIASLKGKMAAKKAEIPTWSAADLGLDGSKVGKSAALVQVGEPAAPPKRSGGEVIQGASAQEKATNLIAKLKERKLL